MQWLNSPLAACCLSKTLTQYGKKIRNFTAFFISSDGKGSHALYLQCHKPPIYYINLISILQNTDPNIQARIYHIGQKYS